MQTTSRHCKRVYLFILKLQCVRKKQRAKISRVWTRDGDDLSLRKLFEYLTSAGKTIRRRHRRSSDDAVGFNSVSGEQFLRRHRLIFIETRRLLTR